jgi:hypothetical protein
MASSILLYHSGRKSNSFTALPPSVPVPAEPPLPRRPPGTRPIL